MKKIHVLHLVGSPTDKENFDLSILYAKDCIEALENAEKYTFTIALVGPDCLWRFPYALQKDVINQATPLTLGQAINFIDNLHVDIAIPQMFCFKGMTEYRSLLSLLGIPILGNPATQMAITADKGKTKAIVSAAGVSVPLGELIQRGQTPTIQPPAVVKPNNGDNSAGVTLVLKNDEFKNALEHAFTVSETALVETYVPLGREVRCGVIVESNNFKCLPLEEYFVDSVLRPIRSNADKLKRDVDDNLFLVAKNKSEAWIVDTADSINEIVWSTSIRCHIALGCQQYSLFDFRIDPQGKPWFLEAGLYCSFSPKSVISSMVLSTGVPLEVFFENSIKQVLDSFKTRV